MRTVLAFISLLLLLTACEADVAAPAGTGDPFSVYGILNPRLERQSLVVSPIEPLLYDYSDAIDAVVTMTSLETGESIPWRDTMVVNARGEREHMFLADFRPAFGTSYRVDVARSDGAVSSAVAHIPELVEVTSDDLGSQIVHVSITGEAFHLLSIGVLYTVRYYAVGMDVQDLCLSPPHTYAVSYTGKESPTSDGYRVAVNVALDHERVMKLFSGDVGIAWRPGINGFALMRTQVRLLVAEKAWSPPGGTFDANLLAQPDVMSNVSNGYGFVGGGYNQDASFFPSEDALGATWFFDFLPRDGAGVTC